MDILSYLLELLQQSNSVGLTGLGTFSKKKFPGRYDKEKQSFLPPGFTLEFSSEIKEDQKLAAFVSKKRNISVESSNYYISQFVEETNKKLEIDHESELEGLGRLFYTEHDGLSFEAAASINYGSEFFGLPALAESKVEAEKETPAITVIEEPPVVAQEENRTEEPVLPAAAEVPPMVENVELDEVKHDFKYTLASTIPVEHHQDEPAEKEVPSAPLEKPEELPQQESKAESTDHDQQVEKEAPAAELPIVDAPEFIKAQHEELPQRFGHQPESELAKTYVNLNEEVKPTEAAVELPIVAAPDFIKEQHAEHPNRFGHDPLLDEEEEEKAAIWPKVLLVVLILLILAALIYYFKPEWYRGNAKVENKSLVVTDSTNGQKDTTAAWVASPRSKQDSTEKTDSILRANQVQNSDTIKKIVPPAAKPKIIKPVAVAEVPKGDITTFEVIGASYETVKGAENFIREARAKGVKAKIVKIHGPRKHVSLGSFKTEKEAREQLSILENKLNGEGFYVQQLINTTP